MFEYLMICFELLFETTSFVNGCEATDEI